MANILAPYTDWLERHPRLKLRIACFADLILNCDAGLYTRMSYGVPFIYRKGPIGYFCPDKTEIYFGFYWGKLLAGLPGSEWFHPDQRKMIKVVYLPEQPDELLEGGLLQLVDAAILIDEQKYGKKKR